MKTGFALAPKAWRALILPCLFAVACASPEHSHHSPASPYAGQESREVKALSERGLQDLRAGAGMGFAMAAELNRYPGPMHALELADRLGLTSEQRERLAEILQRHKADARAVGERIVQLERELDALFASRTATPRAIDRLTLSIGEATGRLRASHLKAHLETTALLTPEQVEGYVAARGYAGAAAPR